jgi:tRNA threonylcarbamoyladenosine biosynthesis protein TsaB
MLILAVDTSGPSCSVALLEDELLRYEAVANNRMTHSVNMMPMVEEAFRKGGCAIDDIDLFVAVVGPGSFTGVRIGVAAVKGMAMAMDKPCIGVDALEALAAGLMAEEIICPIRDARVQQVYGAVFHQGGRIMEDSIMKLDEYLDAISQYGERFLFVGDGVKAYQEAIRLRLGERALLAPAHLNELKAGAAGLLALRDQQKAHGHHDLLPLYLRAPQAERERQRKETNV